MENNQEIKKYDFLDTELGIVRAIVNPDGSISINALDAAVGFGWGKKEIKNGKTYSSVRWATVNGYCKDLGFDNKLSKEDYMPESLFYRLGMKANNEKANKFQAWIANDIIPQIRKTGGYIPIQQANTPMTDEQIMAQAYIIATNTIKLRDQELAAMQTAIAQKECDLVIASDKIEELEPKGDYYDTILKSDKGINISTIADDYKLSGAALNQLLCQWGIQYKRGERYFLYAKYKGLDYVVSEVHPGKHKDGTPANFSHMKWTEIGRRFIYNIMKDHGYLTRAEQVDTKTVKAIHWNERALKVNERVEQIRIIEEQIGIDIQIV